MAFENVEPGLRVAPAGRLARAEWEQIAPRLRERLLAAQFRLLEADFPVILVLSGEDRAGAGEVLRRLFAWMDPRHLEVHALGAPTQEEREKPALWRFWRVLPPRGRMAVFVGGWTTQAILAEAERGEKNGRGASFEQRLAHAERTERMWLADGALLLKFWLTLPPERLERRLARAKRGVGALHEGELDWALAERPKAFRKLAQTAREATATETSPLHVVEVAQRRRRDALVLGALADALEARLDGEPDPTAGVAPAPSPAPPAKGAPRLADCDLSSRVPEEEYEPRLEKLQRRLRRLTARARHAGLSSVVVFEGWDAAGKGGCIRRLTAMLDPLVYSVTQIGAPTRHELAQHYLWRFWTRLARPGRMSLFDRSWYGRVLVERVEKLIEPPVWERAYGEIVDFEEQLAESGVIVHKFWLHIDPDEQLRRFQERERNPLKLYKITEEDYRNRAKWPAYEEAVGEMLSRTHRPEAPWSVVPANYKYFARLHVLETVARRLESALGG